MLEILRPIELADLRVVVLTGDDTLPPAIAIVCDSIGEIDLRWIAQTSALRHTMHGFVAPVAWRATVYKALEDTLGAVLPVFGFEDLFDEFGMYNWDGATTDEDASKALIEWHGHSPEDVDDMTLPEQMRDARPDYMLPENVAPKKRLPAGLVRRLRRLSDTHASVRAIDPDRNAWHFDFNHIVEYVDDFQDRSTLPPMTLVPADHFACELDFVGQSGMELGFMDIAGLSRLEGAAAVDAWFATLRVGAEFLFAAQDLIDLDPFELWSRG